MKQERIKVLEMLEAGKITADEAAKLLESLKHNRDRQANDYWYECDSSEVEEKVKKFSQNVEQFAKDFGDKMETAFKGMEPKLRKATKTVVEKSASVIDDISKALNESLKNMDESECCCGQDEKKDCCEDDKPREN